MVWGAPTSRSSGGRSAVHTSIGTRARSASTTAACSSAAAVPLVTTTTAGRPVAIPMPRAVKPADRSSRRTCTARPRLGRPRPGPAVSTGSRGTPRRGVRRPAPTRRPGWRRTPPGGRHRRPPPDVARYAHCHLLCPHPSCTPTTRGEGPRLVLAHGFTQTGRVWGGLADDLAADHQVVLVDLPGHGASADVPGRPRRRARPCWARPAGRPTTSATRWAPGSACTWPWPAPTWCAAWSWCRARPASTTPASGPSGDGPTRRWPSGSTRRGRIAPQDTVAEFVDRWVANPMFGDVPAAANGRRRAEAQHGGRPGLEPPTGRHRHPGAAVGPAGRADHAGAGRHRVPRHQVHRPRPTDGRGHRRQRPPRS